MERPAEWIRSHRRQIRPPDGGSGSAPPHTPGRQIGRSHGGSGQRVGAMAAGRPANAAGDGSAPAEAGEAWSAVEEVAAVRGGTTEVPVWHDEAGRRGGGGRRSER